jgi:hypothetical protein
MIMKDRLMGQDRSRSRFGRSDDWLGANSDIGNKLRALYGSVQDEGIPDHLLDLLEKLDQAENKSSTIQQGE